MTITLNRSVYRYAQTRRMFDPVSVAIVGASPKASSFGARTLANLGSYAGRIHLVNEKYTEIGSYRCVPNLAAIGEVPDCVVIAVPREAVLPVVAQCVELKVGAVVIYASGFGESTNTAHQQLQRDLIAMTAGTGTLVLGPNCLGIMNPLSGMMAVFFEAQASMYVRGSRSIGIVSQSGAVGIALSNAANRGLSVSHVLTSGNACDVDVADEIAFLAEDPGCNAIVCVFEGITHPDRLIEAGEIARQNGKAVIVFKMATGASGAEAARSHTGALAGSTASYNALFERAGFVVVDQFEALLETAAFFMKAPRASADGVAILTPSGGAGIMAADQAEIYGVPLPQPGAKLKALLESHVPEFGAARNPCDLTAQMLNDMGSFTACAEAFLAEDDIGVIATPCGSVAEWNASRIVELGDLAHKRGKIACVYLYAGLLEGPGLHAMERSPHLGVFTSTGRCFSTLAAWVKWSQNLNRPKAVALPSLTDRERAAVRQELDAVGDAQTLSEGTARRVLQVCGIPVVDNRLVGNVQQAVDAATALGFPVVLKVDTPDLPHKTDAGVVRLGLKSKEEVRSAYDAIMANALKATTAARINGVLVQPMIPTGLEIMVGARVDPLFGPLVMVGIGGILVELLKDTVVALAPVDPATARDMLRRLRGQALFDGFRGSAAVDLDALANTVSRISVIIHDLNDLITEIDVNPIICSASRVVAVDALVVRAASPSLLK